MRFEAIELTLSVRSFHVPATPETCAWPPSLPSVPTSRATRLTSEANRIELVHHGVDGVLQLENFPLHGDGDLPRKIPARDGCRHVRDVAHLGGQIGGHRVDVVGQILPCAGHTWHLRLAPELAFGANLARYARHLGGKRLSWSTMVLMVSFNSKNFDATSHVIFFKTPFHRDVLQRYCELAR